MSIEVGSKVKWVHTSVGKRVSSWSLRTGVVEEIREDGIAVVRYGNKTLCEVPLSSLNEVAEQKMDEVLERGSRFKNITVHYTDPKEPEVRYYTALSSPMPIVGIYRYDPSNGQDGILIGIIASGIKGKSFQAMRPNGNILEIEFFPTKEEAERYIRRDGEQEAQASPIALTSLTINCSLCGVPIAYAPGSKIDTLIQSGCLVRHAGCRIADNADPFNQDSP